MLNGDGNCRFAQVVVGEPSANRLDHELELQINDNLIGELEFYDNQDDPMESSISNEGSHLPQNEPVLNVLLNMCTVKLSSCISELRQLHSSQQGHSCI